VYQCAEFLKNANVLASVVAGGRMSLIERIEQMKGVRPDTDSKLRLRPPRQTMPTSVAKQHFLSRVQVAGRLQQLHLDHRQTTDYG